MNRDWADVLEALQRHGARFLVVGAHAVAVHGIPRGTQGMDVWVDPLVENAGSVWRALVDFGAPLESIDVSVDDFSRSDSVVQIGLPPHRVDVLTSISGVASFDEAWERRVLAEVGGMSVPVLGRGDLLANKRASGRTKDVADLEAMGES